MLKSKVFFNGVAFVGADSTAKCNGESERGDGRTQDSLCGFKKLRRYGIGEPLARLIVCLLCFVSLVSIAYGQVAQQLSGRVTDAVGAVIPDATVTVTDEGTGVALTAKSGSTGEWVEPYLHPDTYTVQVEKTGFKTETVTGIKLDTGQLRAVDTKLQIGAESMVVSVAANQLALQTQDADEKTVISAALINDLPENFRNVMVGSIAVAGVGSKNGFNNQLPYSSITNGLVFNSSAGSLNLDGVNNMSTGFQTMAYIPLVDAVQEMVVTNTPYDAAAVGFATAGNIDVHLKSGTNSLHGSVYEYYKSTGLDANTYSNNYEQGLHPGSTAYNRPMHKSNQYGFELDGPVVIPHLYDGHDKTFFTIAGEIFNQTTPGPNTFSVPGVYGQPSWFTPVNGYYQFNGLLESDQTTQMTIYDPASINASLCNSSPSVANCTRKSFQSEGAPNSYSIPASRVNSTALAILSYFPAPNRAAPAGSAPWQNNYFIQTSVVSKYKNFMIKIDHNISEKDRLTLRWGRWDQFQTQNSNGFPADNPARYGQVPNGQAFQDPAVEWIHTFSPNAIFDFKASINMDENHSIAAGQFNQSSIPGFPNVSGGVTQQSLLNSFPQIGLGGFTQMGAGAPSYHVHNELTLLPSFTYVHGAHNLHIGLENHEAQIFNKQNGGGLTINSSNSWTLTSAYGPVDPASGSSVASLMLDNGYLSGGSVTQPTQEMQSYHYWGAFIQDNYTASQRLTLNVGLRYDFPTQATERHDRYTNQFLPGVTNPVSGYATGNGFTRGAINGVLTYSGANGQPRTQIPRAWYMFEPRFGFAYKIDSKTVARGGFGMAYNWAAYGGAQTGYSASTGISPSQYPSYTIPYATLATPFPNGYIPVAGNSLGSYVGLGTGISYYNPSTKFGSTWSYSMGVQRQLGRGDTLDVSYVGKQYTHGPTGEAINLPPPGWIAQCNAEAGGNPTKCNTNVANPFYGMTASVGNLGVINPFQGTSLANATINSGQLLLPYPEYTGVNENGKENRNGLWLNSLQITETHRFVNSLTLTSTYEYARIMDNNGVFDYAYGTYTRMQDSNDLNHRITFEGTYKLPVGRGRMFLGSTNRLIDAVIGGWNVGGVYIRESGRPWMPQCGGGQHSGLGGSGCIQTPFGIGPIKTPRTVTMVGGVKTIRGASPCVADRDPNTGLPTLRKGAVAYGCTQPNWAYQTPYAPAQLITSTGIRLGATGEFDANLMKSFDVYQGYKFILRVDAFNVDNHPLWANNYSTSNDGGTTAYFGTIQEGPNSQSNNPRSVQLSGTIRW